MMKKITFRRGGRWSRRLLAAVGALAITAGLSVPVMAQVPTATIEYYHVDALGSVRAVTDSNGAVIRTQNYHPFGEGVGVAPGGDPMGFTGKPRDAESGLDYFGARYYAQRLGRFTTVDPAMNVDAALTDPQRWHRYAYARNGPHRYVDPDGRDIVLAIDPRLLESARAFRKSLSSWLGDGIVASAVDTVISTFAPANPREVSDSLMGSVGPMALIGPSAQLHHIATNKSVVSGWTAQFERIFSKAGMSLDDPANKVLLEGHRGRHTKEYHQYVLESLQNAVSGLKGADYKRALQQALEELRESLLSNPGMTQKK